jgi:4-hydroxybenzoate polyprenyltransferase
MLKRIAIYLNEMFPLSSFIGSVLTAVAVQMTYLRLFNIRPDSYARLIVPGLVLTFVSLLIRVMDEFKDYQDDLTNFPNRPLPSGRVKKSDLIALGWFCVFMVIFLSLTSTKLLIWSLLTLGFTFLMLKWFFIESIMRKSLPLAVATHHPIVLFNFVYLLIACTQFYPEVTMDKALYILPLCLIFTNWEVERKIRAPEQETSYTTYSKIFGPRPAILIALIVQAVFIATVYVIFNQLGTPVWLLALFGVVQAVLVFPGLRFLLTLKLPKPLKPLAEAQIMAVIVTLFVAALL